MNQTINYYNKHAKEYCSSTLNADMSTYRERFLFYLPAGSHILDAGCGSGRDSKYFIKQGYIVTAIDASPEICLEAESLLHQPVFCERFEDLSFENEFEGIWACASLLHVSKRNMEDVLKRLKKALKSGGIIYASFKYGNGERYLNGRIFNDYDEDSVRIIFEEQKLEVCEVFSSQDVRKNHAAEKWINVIVKKN